MSNVSENASSVEEVNGGEGVVFGQSPAFSLVWSVVVVLAVVSACLNSTILMALSKVNQSKLKAKYLIKNLCVTHLMVSIINILNPFIMISIYRPSLDIILCYEKIFLFLMMFLYFVQPTCAIVLTADRVYAVLKPLKYNTVGYSKLADVILVALPWLSAVVFSFGVLIHHLIAQDYHPEILPVCFYLKRTFNTVEHNLINASYIFCSYTTAFLFSVCILIIVKRQQRSLSSVSSGSSSGKTLDASLVVTYLFINLSSLIVYSTGPLYDLFVDGVLTPGRPQYFIIIEIALFGLYQSNSYIDLILLLRRVPAIKHNWSLIFHARKREDTSISKILTIDVKQSVITVS